MAKTHTFVYGTHPWLLSWCVADVDALAASDSANTYEPDEEPQGDDETPNPAFYTSDAFGALGDAGWELLERIGSFSDGSIGGEEYWIIPLDRESELIDGLQALGVEVRRDDGFIFGLD